MKYEITKEQLRSLTDPKVKEMFPQAFVEDLEVGKWYKSNEGNLVFNNGNFGKKETYGFGYCSKVFLNEITFSQCIPWTLATGDELLEVLIQEATDRGYKKGLYCMLDGDIIFIEDNSFRLANFKNPSLVMGNQYIFENGKWAEIINKKLL
jgi:hypothetical protein